MLTHAPAQRNRQHGISLIEVLITLVILAIGLLGVAALQTNMSLAQMESYQRSQAVIAMNDMVERISADRDQAASYVTTGTVGTGDSMPSDCTTLAEGPARDLCEWSNELKGASEESLTANVGGIIGARGCIVQVQASNPAPGVCTPGIYRVSVAWQGISPTTTPARSCAAGDYGANDAYRHLVSTAVYVGTTTCL